MSSRYSLGFKVRVVVLLSMVAVFVPSVYTFYVHATAKGYYSNLNKMAALFDRNKAPLMAMAEAHSRVMDAKYLDVSGPSGSSFDRCWSFVERGRMHIMVYRGVPVGLTAEFVYVAERANYEKHLKEYLELGESVLAWRILSDGWIYVLYVDV
ncbi:MAG: hypothetical protein K1X57_19485 [Gemmataceae bacterium]|nr:hypothetical protein [Gemmataceae bacterium]